MVSSLRTPALRVGAAAALLLACGAANAGVLTMQGWLHGPGNHVSLSASPSYTGLAGGFKGVLSNMSNPLFNLNPVEMYCVDLAQFININATYSVKMPADSGSATFTLRAVTEVFNSTISQRLTQLVSWSESSAAHVNTSLESTALQLAIWNTLYENQGDVSGQALSSGSFRENAAQNAAPSAFAATASSMLSSAAAYSGSMKQLYVLQSATNQDQLIWLDSPNQVPVPGTLALAALALIGAAGAARRKQR
jgi:hypothetical protein